MVFMYDKRRDVLVGEDTGSAPDMIRPAVTVVCPLAGRWCFTADVHCR